MDQTPIDRLRKMREKPAPGDDGASGFSAADERSAEVEQAVAAVWDRVGPEGACLVAGGDLGRRTLAPGSEIELLALHAATPEASRDAGQAVKALSFELWPAGVAVAASVHAASELAELAAGQFDLETAVLDGRPIAGEPSLWHEARAVVLERARSDPGGFLARLRRATAARRLEGEEATAALEPNLRDGAGGLADIAAIGWVETVCGPQDLAAVRPQLSATADLLHRARAALHRHTGGGTDLLLLAHRRGVAEVLFGADADPRSEVRLMRLLYEQGRVAAAALDSVLDPGAGEHAAAVRFAAALGTPEARPDGAWPDGAARIFLDILASGEGGRTALQTLDAGGVLVRAIPEWAGIRCLPERRSYHRFSVDDHCLRAAATLATLASDPDQAVRTAAEAIFGDPAAAGHADTLMLATLLHDVGKGGEQNHSERGAELARTIVGRMGLGEEVAAGVAWLVRNHLLLAHMATRRDISDETLMTEVAGRVGTQQRLQLLWLLTVADGRATGPAAWTLWKSTLTARLYSRVLRVLREGDVGGDAADRAEARLGEVRAALADLPRGPVESHLEAMPRAWLMSQPLPALAGQSRLMIDFHPSDVVRMQPAPLAGHSPGGSSGGLWELTVVARDRPGLFSRVSGVLALHDLNVLDAEIYTRADGVALEVFRVDALSEEARRFDRLAEDARKAVRGRISLALRLAEKRNDLFTGRASGHPPRVVIDNEASETFSVVEVHAADGVGLLYTITHALAELQIDIELAKVSTYGEEVVDVFYVADVDGRKLTDPGYVSEIQALITFAVSGTATSVTDQTGIRRPGPSPRWAARGAVPPPSP